MIINPDLKQESEKRLDELVRKVRLKKSDERALEKRRSEAEKAKKARENSSKSSGGSQTFNASQSYTQTNSSRVPSRPYDSYTNNSRYQSNSPGPLIKGIITGIVAFTGLFLTGYYSTDIYKYFNEKIKGFSSKNTEEISISENNENNQEKNYIYHNEGNVNINGKSINVDGDNINVESNGVYIKVNGKVITDTRNGDDDSYTDDSTDDSYGNNSYTENTSTNYSYNVNTKVTSSKPKSINISKTNKSIDNKINDTHDESYASNSTSNYTTNSQTMHKQLEQKLHQPEIGHAYNIDGTTVYCRSPAGNWQGDSHMFVMADPNGTPVFQEIKTVDFDYYYRQGRVKELGDWKKEQENEQKAQQEHTKKYWDEQRQNFLNSRRR